MPYQAKGAVMRAVLSRWSACLPRLLRECQDLLTQLRPTSIGEPKIAGVPRQVPVISTTGVLPNASIRGSAPPCWYIGAGLVQLTFSMLKRLDRSLPFLGQQLLN